MPVAAGEVSTAPRLAVWRGTRYRHFQATTARVEAVLGEFYWEVKKGETTDVSDYVAPPRILSEEKYAERGHLVGRELRPEGGAREGVRPPEAPPGPRRGRVEPALAARRVVGRLPQDDGPPRRDRPLPLRLLQHQGRPQGRLPDAARPHDRREPGALSRRGLRGAHRRLRAVRDPALGERRGADRRSDRQQLGVRERRPPRRGVRPGLRLRPAVRLLPRRGRGRELERGLPLANGLRRQGPRRALRPSARARGREGEGAARTTTSASGAACRGSCTS